MVMVKPPTVVSPAPSVATQLSVVTPTGKLPPFKPTLLPFWSVHTTDGVDASSVADTK